MIYPKKFNHKKYEGESIATITSIESEPNDYYNPKYENSTEEVLSITFDVEEQEGENTVYTQRFISITFGDNRLLDLLVQACGLQIVEGKGFDEQQLIGKRLSLVWGENKKGFNTIIGVNAVEQQESTPVTEKEDSGLPWEE